MNEFLELLDKIVQQQVEKKTGVIYSGGVDSSLLAVLAARHCSVTAYTVGVEGAADIPFAKQLKSDFHHEIIHLSDDDVDAELDRILPVIKKTEGHVSPVRVGAEFPTYFASKAASLDINAIIYTDITKDGMLCGPNLERTKALVDAVNTPIIAAGGVTSTEDIKKLAEIGTAAAIIGRSLYEGSITLPDALNSV